MPTTTVLVGVVAVGLALSAWDLVRSPIIRRLAVRSIARRPSEALLVVVGSMFATAIIGAAFIIGDSFNGSIRDIARRELGPVDVVVSTRPTVDFGDEALALGRHLVDAGIDRTDGTLPAVSSGAVLDNLLRGVDQRILSENCITEIDFDGARRMGDDAAIGGLARAGATPIRGQAVISEETGRLLGVAAGDSFALHLFGTTVDQEVRQVVPTVGLAGYCGALVAPGTIEDAWRRAGAAGNKAETPAAEVLVSIDGGVFDATGPADAVERSIRRVLRGTSWVDADVRTVKKNRLERAERQGDNLRSIFGGVGGFSVISGILLLINLVVMLAEERKVELGVLRAIGLKRRHLVRSFSLEGSLYAAASAALGAVVAIGIGALVILGTQKIFSDPNRRFRTALFVRPATLLTAAGVGYAISMATIWIASARISRLNVISAIRDLPDPSVHRRRIVGTIVAGIGTIGGAGMSLIGWTAPAQIPLLAGIPIAAFSLIGPSARFIPRPLASVVWPLAAIAWILGVFTLFATKMERAGIGVFVTMGVLLVAAAVLMAVALAPLAARQTVRGRGDWGLASRLGLAYPLARPVRTGLLLAMFSLVIFTMTFMASLAATIDGQAASGARDVAAGYDLVLESSPANPLSGVDLADQPEVGDVAMFTQAGPEFTIRYQDEFARWGVSGFDESLLRHGVPRLAERGASFASDRAAFDGVLADPSLIIVDDQFLLRGGGPKTEGPVVGDRVEMRNAAGSTRTLEVAGILSVDFVGHGSLWRTDSVDEFLSPQVVEARAFVRVVPDADAPGAARALAARFATRGVEVSTFTTVVAEQLDDTTSFMRLLEVYLAFGLLIGIAGLGVVMVRGARERRREIAMLRAMGVPARVVYRSFLIEAFAISALGASIGIILALITAYQVVVNSSAFSLSSDSFAIPWWPIVVVAIVPIGASLLASVQPAGAASRVRPAVALRVSD